jgi:hypothetical protein
VTCGEPAPAERISSNARWTYGPNVATKSPIASWLGLSRRMRCTISGERMALREDGEGIGAAALDER